MLFYKQKEGKEKFYGNENSKTREFKLWGLLEDWQFLLSWAEGWVKNYRVGQIVTAELEVEKEFGNLYKIENSKLTGFIESSNLKKKMSQFAITDIDSEKLIADLLPVKNENIIKLKTLIGKDKQFKIISLKEDYSIL